MRKNAKRYLIIVLIIAFIYNVLVFTIPYPHKSNLVFWMAWASGMFAIISQPLIAYVGLKDAKTLKSKIYGWPIIRNGYIYLLIQLIITLIFLIVGAFVVIPGWILPILVIILIGFTVVGMIVDDTYKEEIQKMEESSPTTTKFIDDLKVETKMLVEKANDENIKSLLEKLAEEVNYSDPISNDALNEIEDKINKEFLALKENINSKLFYTLNDDIEELIILIKERNQKAKLAKK